MKVVVLGGYGNFGARVCRALAGDPAIELVVAGRDGRKARALAGELQAGSARIDAAGDELPRVLREAGAELVIHTAGPFQAQGYGVALAAAQAGCHYVDLADGRRFVCDFAAATDAAFRAAGRCAVSGASTVPALSSAVVDALLPRFGALEVIDTCIAPAQKAPRGEATLAGVLSYCGAPIEVWQGGRWQTLRGWADPKRVTFARLAPRLDALCDIPDLELFPQRYVPVGHVMFRAALEVAFTQRVFALLAAMHARGLLEAPQKLAGLLHRAGALFDPFGTPAGGMAVRLRGRDASGTPLALAWHITAPDHHGPEIPCMAAILLARRLARGPAWDPGARPCMGLLTLADFEPEFARWGMACDTVVEAA
jgi:saccharopine dehydrogenase-like NADP-dependent oxidoreductase